MNVSPDLKVLIYFLEKAYLDLADYYGEPVITSPKVWYGDWGVYEELNKLLEENGYRKLSWKEFLELMKYFDQPKYYGIVDVAWAVGKRNAKYKGVQPLVITIYSPITSPTQW